MSFARPDVLWIALVAIAVVIIAMRGYARRLCRLATAYGGSVAARRLTGRDLNRFPGARTGLLSMAAFALAAAGAEPRWKSELRVTATEPLDLVLTLDISLSMQGQDLGPTRLARARELIRDLVSGLLPTDRIGLVLFASQAYTLAPITRDHAVVDYFLDALEPTLVSETDWGTMLSPALRRSAELLKDSAGSVGTEQVIVLFTDGETNEDVAVVTRVAEAAGAAGVRIFTVGLGTERGARLVPPNRSAGDRPATSDDARPAVSRLNASLLRRMARVGNGGYAAASSQREVSSFLTTFRRTVAGDEDVDDRAKLDLMFWLTLAGLGLLVGESFTHGRVPLRKQRRFGEQP